MAERQTITKSDVGMISAAAIAAGTAAAEPKLTRAVFCAGCQADKPHELDLDDNNEIVAVCGCGRHVKFPMVEPAQLAGLLAGHKAANAGQVSAEAAQRARSERRAAFRKLMGAPE